ncbi:hypothetical protein BU24DRAFT_217795 [Aaosphaeria arxii CBS 175.79]|uniref:Uncharacterized protein n=1 Tax=Aaosphaeria arxii CBS 175.79 TaxID=1450172 RepID=A0A6A5XNV4_9PLEO|nr:uncharacterized protein BU24DRAFT_217795 [Aaosphaeria arxii CBS 175.79]KAF2014623.1 hypothetical protein BU24DRAFT_217795 [Aaosphaeria arxii CBS 175.79]
MKHRHLLQQAFPFPHLGGHAIDRSLQNVRQKQLMLVLCACAIVFGEDCSGTTTSASSSKVQTRHGPRGRVRQPEKNSNPSE